MLVVQSDSGLLAGFDCERGRHTITLQIDVLPEAIGVFVHTVQAERHLVAKRLIEIGGHALMAE